MDKQRYEKLNQLFDEIKIVDKDIFVFGHCSASLELIDFLESKGLRTIAILDNSKAKQGQEYKGIKVVYPKQILELAGLNPSEDSIVLITSRFYASMYKQLRELGYEGPIRKLIDYNTFSEYSLSDDTIARMTAREKHGEELLFNLTKKYIGYFVTFLPFNALGDAYFALSYWKAFAEKRNIDKVVFCVPGQAMADVIHMFDNYPVEVYEQKELDAMIQAALYTHDENTFIAHQDRPYVINLSKALYIKKIPLEQIYCCGVYGLPKETLATKPNANRQIYKDIESIPSNKAVIFSPYAKSVTALNTNIWESAVKFFSSAGYKCYTNVVGDEKPLLGTEGISPSLLELSSVVERAGTFIGIRSGLCDIIREAKAKKIALYPDYNYCDTKWKAVDMYWIDQFEYNLLATEEIEWEKL